MSYSSLQDKIKASGALSARFITEWDGGKAYVLVFRPVKGKYTSSPVVVIVKENEVRDATFEEFLRIGTKAIRENSKRG